MYGFRMKFWDNIRSCMTGKIKDERQQVICGRVRPSAKVYCIWIPLEYEDLTNSPAREVALT
jgi:hypothetical protein